MDKALIIILIVIVFILLLFFVLGIFLFNLALNKNVALRRMRRQFKSKKFPDNSKLEEWYMNNKTNEYYLLSNDKKRIYGYEIKNKSNVWVIVVHGYTSCAFSMLSYAKEFYDMGYNVLLIDLKSHGNSDGKYIGMGYSDRLDVLNFINNLIKKERNCKIILYGISMGASTVMYTLGEKLPKNVVLAIEDCGFSSVYDEFYYQGKTYFNLPVKFGLNALNFFSLLITKNSIKNHSCNECLRKNKLPVLFIHGSLDKFVPFYMLDDLYNEGDFAKEKLVIEAEHGASSIKNHDLYFKTIKEFIKKNIR